MYGIWFSPVPADSPSSEPQTSKATRQYRSRNCTTWATLHDVSCGVNTPSYKNIVQKISLLFPWSKQGLRVKLVVVVVTGVFSLPVTVHSSALNHQMQIWQISTGLLFHFLPFSLAAPEYYKVNLTQGSTTEILFIITLWILQYICEVCILEYVNFKTACIKIDTTRESQMKTLKLR
jgi:hypothetical protein